MPERALGVSEGDSAVSRGRVAQRQGWDLNSVSNEQKGDREKNRIIRVRQRAIGRELRRIYDNVVKEPIPDDFAALLQKMDEREDEHEDEPEER
jgi:hypothetical protein